MITITAGTAIMTATGTGNGGSIEITTTATVIGGNASATVAVFR
jgi:hypothetical protein